MNKTLRLKTSFDEMKWEDQEKIQTLANEYEMMGFAVTVLNPDGVAVEVI
jgi:hypothetical protein